MITRFTLCIIGLILPFCLSGQSIVLDGEKDAVDIGRKVWVLKDNEGSLTLKDVSSPLMKSAFGKSGQAIPNFGHTKATVWFRIEVKPRSDKKWFLEIDNPLLSDIVLYSPRQDGSFDTAFAGSRLPFESRPYKLRSFVLPLNFKDDASHVFYLKIRSTTVIHTSLKVTTLDAILEASHRSDVSHGIYLGFMVLMVLYNLLIYFSVRDRAYWYYVLYVASVGTFVANINGFTFQFLPGLSGVWTNTVLIATLTCIFAILFTSVFLQTSRHAPAGHKGLMGLLAGLLAVVLIDLSGNFIWSGNILKAIVFAGPIYIYILSISIYRNGYRPAKHYTIAWTFILVANVLTALYYSNLIPGHVWITHSIQLGSAVEVLLLSFALADRINIYKKEKEDAQNMIIGQLKENEDLKNKINRELEDKVRERTKDLYLRTEELEQANIKLKDLTEQLNKLNSKLDVDNWELKNKVKEKTKAIILFEEVSYEEFCKVFPDELSCYRHLEEVKWGAGYLCRKCGNNNYSASDRKFSRKCNRCDHIESVTAYTLFHSIKFPINKAFYIIYITTLSKVDLTLKELSETLDLRPNTCSAFRRKVQERKEKVLARTGKKDVERWESLVLND